MDTGSPTSARGLERVPREINPLDGSKTARVHMLNCLGDDVAPLCVGETRWSCHRSRGVDEFDVSTSVKASISAGVPRLIVSRSSTGRRPAS